MSMSPAQIEAWNGIFNDIHHFARTANYVAPLDWRASIVTEFHTVSQWLQLSAGPYMLQGRYDAGWWQWEGRIRLTRRTTAEVKFAPLPVGAMRRRFKAAVRVLLAEAERIGAR